MRLIASLLLCVAGFAFGPLPAQAVEPQPQAVRKPARPAKKPARPDLRKIKPKPLKKPLPSTK